VRAPHRCLLFEFLQDAVVAQAKSAVVRLTGPFFGDEHVHVDRLYRAEERRRLPRAANVARRRARSVDRTSLRARRAGSCTTSNSQGRAEGDRRGWWRTSAALAAAGASVTSASLRAASVAEAKEHAAPCQDVKATEERAQPPNTRARVRCPRHLGCARRHGRVLLARGRRQHLPSSRALGSLAERAWMPGGDERRCEAASLAAEELCVHEQVSRLSPLGGLQRLTAAPGSS
jgi:hypothetical protein